MIVVLERDDDNESDDFVDQKIQRIQLCDDNLDEWCLEKLNLEFECLREITRVIIQKAIEEIINFYLQLKSADEIFELLSQEISRLQELYACQLRK
ncbi:hypothetical protein Glove_384g17 [Diversispora epigaea]|uniref:Uncharacterized protein n=1 Tax=Diversispora epigaea TaxID=1348612 RepID=A0A397H4R3_9GLOM|nr:hypothetical protein Glove_384g17 [Diversispora epigaea]